MKRLGVDARGLYASVGAGVAHASRELIVALNHFADEYGIEIVSYSKTLGGRQMQTFFLSERIDHVLVPSGAVSPFLRGKIYPWVHDLAIFDHPEWFPQSFWKRVLTTRLYLSGLRKASHVFCVSRNTKDSLMRVAQIPPDIITVTFQGVKAPEYFQKKSAGKYALILGTVEPRKNIAFIDSLWPRISKLFPECRLLVAGRNGWGNIELRNAEREDVFDDARRDEVLRNASVLLLPSLHEGFGRTALEAMTYWVPVIASNRGALPEILGSSGRLIDPDDIEGWVKGISDAFQGKIDTEAEKGQALRFSWENTARIMLAKIAETW